MTDTIFPLEPTAAEAQHAIIEEFGMMDYWALRYAYLLELGQKLPEFPSAWKTEQHRLMACQSRTWVVAEGDKTRLDFFAVSESIIVSGLIYLALRVYSGRSAAEIVATEPEYVSKIGLNQHLSQGRNNGIAALLAFIRETARQSQ